MTVSLEELNQLPESEAADLFRSACGSSSWVGRMVKGRPYDSVERVLASADTSWKATVPGDWREAFEHHPRIGETESVAAQGKRAKSASISEQARARLASSSVHDQMSLVNIAYESKFGHIYIVSAEGKKGAELLEIARKRLKNSPDKELKIAAEEQRQITRLRLAKLLGDSK